MLIKTLQNISKKILNLVYKTDDANRYLKFLESFDNTKFEIVDISYGYQDHVDEASKHDEFIVTYRSR